MTASEVDRKLRRYLDDRPSATVSVPPPPRDSVSTFIQDLETNIRSKVKPTFHDDLFHEINTTVLAYKKKQHQQSRIINFQDLQYYNPALEYHITQQQLVTSVHLITSAQPPALQPQPPLQPPPLQQQQQQQQQQEPPLLQPQQGIQVQLPQGIPLDLHQDIARLEAEQENLKKKVGKKRGKKK